MGRSMFGSRGSLVRYWWRVLAIAVIAPVFFTLVRADDDRASAGAPSFADGFESGDFSAWTSVTVSGAAAATVQSGIVRTGAYAARLGATQTAGAQSFVRKDLDTAGTEVRTGGAFHMVSEGLAGGNVPFLRFFDASDNRQVSLYRQNGSGGLWLRHSGVYYSTGRPIALGVWYDLELRAVAGAAGAGIVEAWLDGTKVYSTSMATIGTAPIATVQLGNETAGQGFDIFADNITITSGGAQSTPTPVATATGTPGASPSPSPVTPTPKPATPTPTPRPATPTPRPATPSPTPTPAPAPFSFGVSGDLGANSNTSAVLNKANTSGLSMFVALGDFSYNEVTPESAWCNFVKNRVGSTFPFELVAGNHEDDGPDGLVSNFKNCLPDRIGGLTGTYPKQYYYDFPKTKPTARFIFISPGLTFPGEGTYSYNSGSSRYNWVASAIDQARSSGIKWVIVGMHKYCIAMVSGSCQIGPDIMNLLVNKKVDLYLQGHDHAYYRSKQLAHRSSCSQVLPGSYNSACVVDSGADGLYTQRRRYCHPDNGGGRPVCRHAQPQRLGDRLLREVDGQQCKPDLRLHEDHSYGDRDFGPVRPRRGRQLHRYVLYQVVPPLPFVPVDKRMRAR